jgi:hypothetical protein
MMLLGLFKKQQQHSSESKETRLKGNDDFADANCSIEEVIQMTSRTTTNHTF